MFSQLSQYSDVGYLLLRIAIAIIFLVHGLPKISKAKEMSGMMGMPAAMIFLLGAVESLSAAGLALGLYVQLSALALSVVMLGALSMKAFKWGVPFSAHDKTGWEFDFILLCACISILLGGGGLIGLQI